MAAGGHFGFSKQPILIICYILLQTNMHSKFQKKQKKVSMFVESENSIQAATF
jgi:hypothetical protein